MKKMKLRHFSDKQVTLDLEYHYKPQSISFKPNGFWVSDEADDGWRRWCESESFCEDRLEFEHSVEFSEKANILYIRTLEEIDSFHRQFRELPEDLLRIDYFNKHGSSYIDWRKVASRYDGIIITPYQWERRLAEGFLWYYGWDCASGCIWNLKAIKEVKLLTKV